jgi:hypothetical protein
LRELLKEKKMKKLVLMAALCVTPVLSLPAQTENYLFEVFTTPVNSGFLSELGISITDEKIWKFPLLERTYKEMVCNIWYSKCNLIPIGPNGTLRLGPNGEMPIRSNDAIRKVLLHFLVSLKTGTNMNGGPMQSAFTEDCYWIVLPCVFNGERITLNIYAYYTVPSGNVRNAMIEWAAFKGEVPEQMLKAPFDYR